MANIQEVKQLLGSMDKENSPETVDRFDYIDAHNIRSVGNDESDANYTSSLEGNRLITKSSPSGQNRSVGNNSFESISKAYYIRFNSAGYHQIIEFDYDTEEEVVIFENLTDTDGEDIFPIKPETYFSDIRLIHDIFLILNDGVNPMYMINVQKFKENRRVGTVVKREDLLLIKAPPVKAPEVKYIDDSSKTTNPLRGNLFQFRTQYEYEDFRSSVWSTISKRVVPINEPANGQGQNVSLNNALEVRINIGSDRVEKINVATRIGLGSWLLVKEVDIDYIKSLPRTTITLGVNTEAYNPATNEYIFLFYNDGLYPVVDQIEVESNYDHIPHKAETVEVINGDILAVGGLTEGYDRPEIESVDITTTQYAPNLSSNIIGGSDFDFSHVRRPNDVYAEYYFKGTPKQGDVMYVRYKLKSAIAWTQLSYTVTATNEVNGLDSTVLAFFNAVVRNIPSSPIVGARQNYLYTSPTGGTANLFDLEFYVVRKDIGYLTTQSINTLKSNSSYQLALAYYDEFGRSFPIVTDDRFIVNTKSLTETQGLLSQINWNIQEEAPEGAKSYQWLLSENQKYQKSIYLTGKLDSTQTSENYITFEIKSLERFLANEKESQVNYTFTKGDKVILMYTTNGSNNTKVDWFRYPFIELDIVDFVIEENPELEGDIKYLLKVRNTSLLTRGNPPTINWLNNKDIMMEIYTPKKRDISTENLMFYEIGEVYTIEDGKHTVTSGSIRAGDWYYRGRLFESTINANTPIIYEVEDPNFSDNYISNFWSAGRPRIYNDEVGRVDRKGSIRYSDEYVFGSKYNGINRFYSERIYGETGGQTTSKYGWIKKLETRDNSLVCIQEFKVGIIPVYKSIIYDNTDTSLVADSGKIFGSVQYRTGNYGCGSAKESISVTRNGLIYFFDDNNCLPLRDSLSGLDIIDRNMTSHFVKYAKEAKDKGAKFIGYYDNYNMEWNLTIESASGRTFSIEFKEGDVVYKDTFLPLVEDIILGQPANGAIFVDSNYNLTYTPNLDFVGVDTFSLSFENPETELVVKQQDVLVSEGDSVPDQFDFINKINQQLSTVVESDMITVTGINMSSNLSVAGGQYSINGGSWASTPTMVNNGDTVKVRHTTSASHDAITTTTLNIGGVTASFSTTTVSDATPIEGEVLVTATGYIQNGVIMASVTLSHAVEPVISVTGWIEYRDFGSTQVTPEILFDVPEGLQIDEVDTGITVTSNGQLLRGELLKSSSSVPEGSMVLCKDGKYRTLHVQQEMLITIA